MKVLFVCSGNSKRFSVAPFIKTQGDSLVRKGIEVTFFSVRKNGLFGYLQEAIRLKRYLKEQPFDVIHAHYSLSGWCTVLAFPNRPIVLSLMGDDANGGYSSSNHITLKSRFLLLLTILIQPFVNIIICKSEQMSKIVWMKNKCRIVPNGVVLEEMPLLDKNKTKRDLGIDRFKYNILFLGDPKDKNKNYQLLKDSINLIGNTDYTIIAPYPISHDHIASYLNAADVLVVPSFMEGSPNIVKEAMACNCPVVGTDVGDMKWLFGKEGGYFITDFTPSVCAMKIVEAVKYSIKQGRTKGRNRIVSLGLNTPDIADKIVSIYKNLI